MSDTKDITPERISELAALIQTRMQQSLKEIGSINTQVRILSVNAQIEAARAGDAGRSFGVVATYMGELSSRTATVADGLASGMQANIEELGQISQRLSHDVRGQRLADLALTNIDLIDRNLYERTCDVRWWATDASLVQACEHPEQADLVHHASQRMGVILDAYTVYYDLVLCTLDGHVLANGRPQQYRSAGKAVTNQEWFQAAIKTASGDEYGFEGVHPSPLVDGQRVLVYSCGVREHGLADGKLIGVLGILFNWDSLAQTVVQNTPLTDTERPLTRVLIVNKNGKVLADTAGRILTDTLSFDGFASLMDEKKGFTTADTHGSASIVAHALSPGYETYATGWHSVIIQQRINATVAENTSTEARL